MKAEYYFYLKRCGLPVFALILVLSINMTAYTRHVQATPSQQVPQSSIFLPLISNSPSVDNPQVGWQPNPQEQQLEALFVTDLEQHRQHPTRQDILSKVARVRAQDMAQRHYFSHTDPDGHEANFLVEQADYPLPDYYPDNGNNIESIGLNFTTPAETWQGWKNSPAHRTHVLGEDDFFAAQNDYGFGYAENGDSRYWVIITATH